MNRHQPTPATQQLLTCVDEFINYDNLSGLIHTMEQLQNAFMENSDLDGTDAHMVTETISESARITTFFVKLSERYEAVRREIQ